MSDLDRIGNRYEEHHRDRRAGGEFVFVPERLPLFVQAVGGPGRTVLDLGCRSGAVTQHFLEGNDVTGVDVDPAALERAAERGIAPVRANAEEALPFADDSFDAVVAGELLEHVRDPADVVSEVRRVLRPGGTFVGSVPNAFRLQSRLLFLAGRPPEDDPTHLHMYSPAQLRRLLDAFAGVELHFVGGRYRRLHARLLARDLVFVATAPA
jgi:2-polyprenyl-6-hydroxyphenyl methylase/3-demethylubiquinone-9 3-methyltransferase